MKRLVVIGAGISGLCAAHEASHRARGVGDELEILVLEGASEVGGKARSIRDGEWLVEAGPTGYLDNEPELDELLGRCGLGERKVEADQAAARRYLHHGRLREVQASPLKFATSGIMGAGGLGRIFAEPFIRRASPEQASAESIWDFAARRLGAEAADKLIAPMVLGVFAGDARELSLQACFPKLAKLERDHGSLIRGMWATRRSRDSDQRFATGPSGKLVSFREGLQSLPRMLAERGEFTLRCGAHVESIESRAEVGDPAPSGYSIHIRGDAEPIVADAVIAAGESFANAELLRGVAPAAAASLRDIATPAVAVVALGYGPEVARRFPTGFGVLVPRGQGYRILGCIWDSQLFPSRCPEGHLLVRAMIGGGIDPEAGDLTESELIERAREEVHRMFDLVAPPVYSKAVSWPRAIPQYDLDHLARVRDVEVELDKCPGVFLAGNGLHGVAFAKSAVTGIRTGAAAVAWLTSDGRPRLAAAVEHSMER